MFLEMACQCGASIQLEGVNDTYTLLMGTRFAEAHVACGFVSPLTKDEPRSARRSPKPRAFKEDDED